MLWWGEFTKRVRLNFTGLFFLLPVTVWWKFGVWKHLSFWTGAELGTTMASPSCVAPLMKAVSTLLLLLLPMMAVMGQNCTMEDGRQCGECKLTELFCTDDVFIAAIECEEVYGIWCGGIVDTRCPPGCVRDDLCLTHGDGFCDVDDDDGTPLNTANCTWDGGDCCYETCVGGGCEDIDVSHDDYLCLDPEVVSFCPNSCNRTDHCRTIGDGTCNADSDGLGELLNSFDCDWDGGDCCPATCVGPDCVIDYALCLDPDETRLELIIAASVGCGVVFLILLAIGIYFLRKRAFDAMMRAKDAKRIITLVEDTAYSIPFDHLKIGKLLAAGGAGQVYEGTFSGQPVAIKELFSVLFDPQFLTDLKAEAVRY